MGKHSRRERSESPARRHKRSKHDKDRSRSRQRSPRGSEDRRSQASSHTPPPRSPSPGAANAALLQSILTHLENQEKRMASIEVRLPPTQMVEPHPSNVPPTDENSQNGDGNEIVAGRQTKYETVLRNRGCEPGVTSC